MKVILLIFAFLILIVGGYLFIHVFILKKPLDKDEIKYQMEEFKKSRSLIGSLCLIIALILTFVLSPALTTALNKKEKVLESVRDIKMGEKLNQSMFKEVEVGSYNLSNQIIKSKDEIENTYTTVPILKGQYIYKNSISKDIPYENEYLYNSLTGFNRAISFSINKLANGLSNKLMQGDIISLIFVENGSQRNATEIAVIPEELKYVEVLTTTNTAGIDTEDIDSKKEDGKIYQTITVLVCDEQAKLIAGAESSKQIYTELVYRQGNKKIASYYLDRQRKILDKLYPDRIDPEEKEDIEKILKNENIKEDNTLLTGEDALKEVNEILKQQLNEVHQERESIEKSINEEDNEEIIESIIETTEYKETIKETEKETEKETINPEIEELERIKREYGIAG